MAAETKERIIDVSAELLRRQGYAGTGVKQIVAAAKAPFGSIYHHFPGGKEELGAAAIRRSGALYELLIPEIFDPAPDLVSAVRLFFEGAAAHLEESEYEDACPIATVALEVASSSEKLREATHDVFESWLRATTDRMPLLSDQQCQQGLLHSRRNLQTIGVLAVWVLMHAKQVEDRYG